MPTPASIARSENTISAASPMNFTTRPPAFCTAFATRS